MQTKAEKTARKKNEDISRETEDMRREEIIVEDVEEWIPSAAAMDVEWLFRCHGCSGPERTYKCNQLFSVKHKEEHEE